MRRLFDQVIKQYPSLKPRLAATAAIVNYPDLELGVVKLQRGEALNLAEKTACAEFRAPSVEQAPEIGADDSSIVKTTFKRRKVARRSYFVDVAYIPPTSNECECFLSSAKLVLLDLRKRMNPEKLEMVMCLMYNRDLWDVSTVDEVRSRIGRNNTNN